MAKRILLILGHPDEGSTYCRALADSYAGGALAAGHEVRRIDLATFEFPWLRSKAAFTGAVPPSIVLALQDVRWSDHLVFVFPLWLGTMPALLKAFLEQLLRPGFAHEVATGFPRGLLKGHSARVFVTMACRRRSIGGSMVRTGSKPCGATSWRSAESARSASA